VEGVIGTVPTSFDDVTIPTSTKLAFIPVGRVGLAESVFVQASASLTVSGSLSISGGNLKAIRKRIAGNSCGFSEF
jgi:hypothetical protein